MFSRPGLLRPLGFVIAAGLAWLLRRRRPAQFSYGYDSFVYGAPPAQSFWSASGYMAPYTDPSTGVFQNGQVVPPRTAVPYSNPPYGAVPAVERAARRPRRDGDGLGALGATPSARPPARRGIILRRP